MNALQHPAPALTEGGGGFINAGRDALEGCIEAALGDSKEAIDVAPNQEQQRCQCQGAADEHQRQGENGARDGIAQPRREGQSPQASIRDPALGDGEHEADHHRQGGRDEGQAKGAQSKFKQFGAVFALELVPAEGRPDQGKPQAQEWWSQAEELAQPALRPAQAPALFRFTAAADGPAAAPAPQGPLGAHQ